jgi:alpha-beta hydrolase superfamily lysophospholipase
VLTWAARRVLKWTALVALLLVSGCSSLTSLYFYPQTVWIQTPENLGLSYQDVWLQAADGTQLHAWWIPPQQPLTADAAEPDKSVSLDTGAGPGKTAGPAGRSGVAAADSVVLYLHGNAENISSHIRSVDWLPAAGVGVLALDYRGFGASQGRAMMPSVLQDVEAAAAWLQQHQADKHLVVLGQSMGAALAVNFVAAAGPLYGVDALLLDAPFSGFPQVARAALTSSWLGWLFVPGSWLIPSQWNPADLAPQITVPTLVMHSEQDQVIPVQQGRKVFEQLSASRCWLDSRGPHVASFLFEDIRLISQEFILSRDCGNLPRLP